MGDFGERVAAARLEAAGMELLARNVRTASGEIDLLAKDGDDLVFVEVRARHSADGGAAESVTRRKVARMWQCATEWCEANGADTELVRLDVLAIDLGEGGRVDRVEHFRGVGLG
ncbi:hypothetical protein AYO38_08180 [bacterium SCGC AG-212-C10]|nr:hypothetical protein AYO38_08180 [bacterium SCGC AG-212-C10]